MDRMMVFPLLAILKQEGILAACGLLVRCSQDPNTQIQQTSPAALPPQ